MALTLQIKRSTGSTAPSSLADGELAYTHGNEKFYIGDGSTVKLIGGKAYNDLIDHTAGTLTAGSAILVDSNKAVDDFIVGNNSTTGGSLKFKEGTSNGTDHVALKAPNSLGASVTFTLPNADGSANQVLTTNGSGQLSFADATTQEEVEDIVAAQLVTNGSHTLISAAYDDAGDGAIDLTVDNDLSNYSNANSGFLTAETNDLSAAVTWANVPDANITESSVTQHEAALSITESQISDLQSYLTAETNDLSAAVVWANVPNANITQGSVTQHQAALSIATTQLTGTITNAQLGGSITNAKLVNSSVTIGSDTVSLGGTQTDLNGITSLDVDNITVDANTISTTNSNGNLALAPDGTGTVTVPSGYEARAGFGSDSLVNKTYVDQVANGLDVKASVRVATTADLSATYANGAGTLTANANGAISIDGVSLSLNDRVLVKDQSDAVQNGFYKVTTVGSGSAAFVLTRTPDANEASEITGGAFTFVEEGTANADNGYVATHNGTPTLGTDDITFDQFSGAGQISAGNGLTKTGNTIDAVGTADKITVSANAITIASTYVGQSSITTLGTITTGTWNADTIAVASGGTGLTSVAKGSVLVANSANTLSALDGGGSDDGILFYTANTDTLSFATSIDGGTF
jgi:hypothetical protein